MCSKANDKKRSILVDMIKGIAIILVCYGHCIQYGSGLEFNKGNSVNFNWKKPIVL